MSKTLFSPLSHRALAHPMPAPPARGEAKNAPVDSGKSLSETNAKIPGKPMFGGYRELSYQSSFSQAIWYSLHIVLHSHSNQLIASRTFSTLVPMYLSIVSRSTSSSIRVFPNNSTRFFNVCIQSENIPNLYCIPSGILLAQSLLLSLSTASIAPLNFEKKSPQKMSSRISQICLIVPSENISSKRYLLKISSNLVRNKKPS